MFGTKQLEEHVKHAVETVMYSIMDDTKTYMNKLKTHVKLTQEIEDLKISRGRLEEDNARSLREVEHKVGLERMRQDQDIKAATRDALLTVREENLTADRARFEEQMKFHEVQFTEQVDYLKGMVASVLEALPSMHVEVNAGPHGPAKTD